MPIFTSSEVAAVTVSRPAVQISLTQILNANSSLTAPLDDIPTPSQFASAAASAGLANVMSRPHGRVD